MRLIYGIDIDAAPEAVFDLVSDIERMPEWMDSLTESEYVSGSGPGRTVGTKFRQRASEMGRDIEYEGEISIYDRPARFAVTVVSKDFSLEIDINVVPRDQGAYIEYSAEMTKASFTIRMLASAFSSTAQKILEKQINNLKALAESL